MSETFKFRQKYVISVQIYLQIRCNANENSVISVITLPRNNADCACAHLKSVTNIVCVILPSLNPNRMTATSVDLAATRSYCLMTR